MILILLAIIALTALSIWGAKTECWSSVFYELFCPIFAIIGFIALILYSFLAYGYIAADYKKDIINREYKTSYTREEVFYASDVIDTVRELNRQRIEVNGDLLKDK